MSRSLAIAAGTAAVVAALALWFFGSPHVTASATESPVSVAVIGTTFVPSRNGLAFVNPVAPANASPIARFTTEQCGGMAFTAIDYFREGQRPPKNLTATSALIRQRSFQSIVANGWRFMVWSALPDASASRYVRGVGQLTREQEVGKLSRALTGGPVALGLVRARSLSTVRLNHQVVAYRIKRRANKVAIYVYDPVQPGSNNVRLELDLKDEDGKIVERRDDWTTAEWRGLFVERYVPRLRVGKVL